MLKVPTFFVFLANTLAGGEREGAADPVIGTAGIGPALPDLSHLVGGGGECGGGGGEGG